MVFRNKFHCFTAIVRFGDNFKIGLLFEEKPDAGSDDGVVVGEENANLCQGWKPRWQNTAIACKVS
jgi:hypothetical protein